MPPLSALRTEFSRYSAAGQQVAGPAGLWKALIAVLAGFHARHNEARVAEQAGNFPRGVLPYVCREERLGRWIRIECANCPWAANCALYYGILDSNLAGWPESFADHLLARGISDYETAVILKTARPIV